MFPKYLIEYQNVKIVQSKFKSEKSNKNQQKSNLVLKENEKKRHENRHDYMTCKYLFPYL